MQDLEVEIRSPLAVVAHDAGATNLIIGWLVGRAGLNIRPCLSGPALKLWASKFGSIKSYSLEDCLAGASMLISGTSYDSITEHKARALAKNDKIFSVGVIDHWVNYKDRFLFNGDLVYPDEIWVSDERALNIANNFFSDVIVRQKPNTYLEKLVEKIKFMKSDFSCIERNRILYVLEPVRYKVPANNLSGEFAALNYFINFRANIGILDQDEIRLRLHPSDPPDKYNDWLVENSRLNISIDKEENLAKSIAWANTIVGCETYAMVVGLATGCRVISSLPPFFPSCRLLVEGIEHMRDIV